MIQLLLALLITAGVFAFKPAAALSALLGGATVVVANAFFAFWIFGRYRAQDPSRLVMRFYGGELLKLVLIALMFGAAFLWVKPLNPVALFVAFFVVQVFAPLLAHRFSD